MVGGATSILLMLQLLQIQTLFFRVSCLTFFCDYIPHADGCFAQKEAVNAHKSIVLAEDGETRGLAWTDGP